MKYIVHDFRSAYEFLCNDKSPVILTNAPSSTRYYGAKVLYHMMQKLQQSFPQVNNIVMDIGDDYSAYYFCKMHDIRLLSKPIYKEEVLEKSKMSTAEYIDIFEERKLDLTTKLPLEIEFRKKSIEIYSERDEIKLI